MKRPKIGIGALRSCPDESAWENIQVRVARTQDDLHRVYAMRTLVYMGEQNCPFDEEFDGNDLTATHLLAEKDGAPVAALRMRWFANFAKLERVCLLCSHRGQSIVQVIVAHGFEIASRKGYRHMIAQVRSDLWPMWNHVMDCQKRPGRAPLVFSDHHYTEVDIQLPRHPGALSPDSDPYQIIRPEGDWDAPGVLDASAERSKPDHAAAA